MKNQIVYVAAAALFLGAGVGYFVSNKDKALNTTGMEDASGVPKGMHRMPDGSLMGNMDHSSMMVSSEREFVAGMIPHHQEAVDTAKEVIARGGSTPEVKKLVEDIVVAQEKEIAEMKEWYQDWYRDPYVDNGRYEPMMRDLSNLSGADLDKVFLEDMIGHHMGAIMMAQSVKPYIEHEEIRILSEAIIESQSVEIDQMRQMLNGF